MNYWRKFKYKIINHAYPPYDCEDCVGAGKEWGCYCRYYGATAPCEGPSDYHVFIRKIIKFLWNYPSEIH